MEIIIEPHTLERAVERGISKEEIELTINEGIELTPKYNKLGKYKIFDFNNERNKKFYRHKKVEVYYLIENEKIITVTAFAFYGEWKE